MSSNPVRTTVNHRRQPCRPVGPTTLVEFTAAELDCAVDVLRTIVAASPPPPKPCRCRDINVPLPPRNERNGQFMKCRQADPDGNQLPIGVTWFGGMEPGYRVESQAHRRRVAITVPYREFPGAAGICRAEEIKTLLVRIREVVPARCMPAFARAVEELAEVGCGCGEVGGIGRDR